VLNLLQEPIVVDVVRQPPITPEISYGSVLLAALWVLGILFVASIASGLLGGIGVVLYKRWRDSSARGSDPTQPSHTRLRI
jgi:hypothetical protein